MKTILDHARELLRKAYNDLIAARAILATGEALDTVYFHAQQAVEKASRLFSLCTTHRILVGMTWRS